MKHNIKSKMVGLSALALTGAVVPNMTSCSQTSEFFTVKNNKGLEIEFCDVGASIYSMKFNNTYLTYHPADRNTFMDKDGTPYYYGKTLGRVAGRFKDGKYTLDGVEHQVQVNEKSTTKNNCLHGGTDAFSFKSFKHSLIEQDDSYKIVFNYFSPADEAGFPESVDVWVVYTLYKDQNKLDTSLFAVPSGKTVINLSTHSLFRLGNDGNVLDYILTIPTDTRAEYDNEATKTTGQCVISTTKAVTDNDGIFNFKEGKAIGKDIEKAKEYDPISNGYDHIWTYPHTVTTENRYVNLYNPNNKINFKVTAKSDKVTGFILYSNDYPRDGQIMSDGKQDTQYAGITIEPYAAFLNNDTGGLDDIVCDQDNPFYTSYSYEIEQK